MKYSTQEEKELFEKSKTYLEENLSKSQSEAKEHIEELRKLIIFHEWRYYVKNDPLLSDYEYDRLFDKLKKLEEKFPQFVSKQSPTQRVGDDLTTSLATVTHLVPMLSLANSYNAEDLKDFDTSIRKLLNVDENFSIEYAVEPKYDGGSLALVYENDILVRGATRGNGSEGEDITFNTRAMRSIPLKAPFSKKGIQTIELRGEAVIRKDRFLIMNAERAKEGLSLFANPRNTATGGLRTKDPNETAKRNTEAFIYQIGYAVDEHGKDQLHQLATHDKAIAYLGKMGFKIPVKERKLCRSIEEAAAFCVEWENKRENYPYEIDGMVIKLNDFELQERCGYTSHHPRWAIAYKFKAKQATTTLENVEYQVGKIGSITPVAKVKPVQLAGVTVSSVSLHNEDFINERDIRMGDQVLVERAGDVIPYIVKPLTDLRTGQEQRISFPSHCPSCQTPLVRQEEEAAWRCPNYQCPAQVLQRIIHHVSKDAMDIDGFGKANVERFYQLGWLRDISDVYNLDYEAVGKLEGFGSRSVFNLESAINAAKKQPLYRFLYSLSIHHLGKKVSKLLAAEIKHVMDLKDWKMEQFTDIKDVGPVVAKNVMAFFENAANIELLQRLEDRGVNVVQTEKDLPQVIDADAPLLGKTILFTGSLTIGRKEAQQLAERAGAKNISAVSSKLDILVAGEKAGSKLKKATALGTVTILNEQEFREIIKN